MKENDFDSKYGTNDDDYLIKPHNSDKEIIATRIYRLPEGQSLYSLRKYLLTTDPSLEFAFPSLASIFPFLEEALTDKPVTWLLSRAHCLEDYVALWIESHDQDCDPILVTMLSYSAETIGSSYPARVPIIDRAENVKYYLFLVPRPWLDELQFSQALLGKILATRHKRRAWIVDREDIESEIYHED